MTKCKAGSKLYKSIEVPINAEIKVSPKGREYYISAIDGSQTIIRFIDDGTFFRLNSSLLK